MVKGKPKRDGSGRGLRLNIGRGGCKIPQSIGRGMRRARRFFRR